MKAVLRRTYEVPSEAGPVVTTEPAVIAALRSTRAGETITLSDGASEITIHAEGTRAGKPRAAKTAAARQNAESPTTHGFEPIDGEAPAAPAPDPEYDAHFEAAFGFAPIDSGAAA